MNEKLDKIFLAFKGNELIHIESEILSFIESQNTSLCLQSRDALLTDYIKMYTKRFGLELGFSMLDELILTKTPQTTKPVLILIDYFTDEKLVR